MAFQVTITNEADRQFHALPVREQRLLEAAIPSRLIHQPTAVSKAVKELRPNPFAEFELRVGDLRVLYNVEGNDVVLLIIGRKVGNTLVVDGEEFHEHQDHPPESAGDGPSGDVG